jgi:glycosyltransferase involved in cell wall biosynthesis
MTSFKLMIVCAHFFPRVGGAEAYVLNIIKFLNEKYDVDVVVVCSASDDNYYKEEYLHGIKVYRIPYSFKISSTPINIFWTDMLNSIIDKEMPDILNGHLPVPYIADIAARIANKKNIPYVLTYHNDLTGYNPIVRLLSRCYYTFIGNKTLEISKKIVVTSPFYASSSLYIRKYTDKLEIISPGVDTNIYNILDNMDKDRNSILFVGQLNKESQHKGLSYLLDAINIIRHSIPTVKLIVVGKGNYVDHYKMLVRSMGLTDNVKFMGLRQGKELAMCYNRSAVLVLPSYNRAEGFGMVLIEAQACGTPAIGTMIGGIPYAVKDGETGILVHPKNSKMLADAILKIITNENLLKEMGRKGCKRVREEFSWEKSSDKMFEILSDEIAKHKINY